MSKENIGVILPASINNCEVRRTEMKSLIRSLPVVLGLAVVVAVKAGAAAPAKTRDVCIASPTGGGSFNTFIIRGVEPLSRFGAISLQGLFFTGARKVAPFHGSAVMVSDGTVRVGLFVHSTAESVNDFTVAGVTDTDFVGTLNFDNDGDFKPNGTLATEVVDCATISIP
jgi:hypothetical protein